MTVPASFDAVARELTLEAAKQAGLREHHPARRAAGGLLRVDRAAPRLARAREGGRPDPGGGYRRRHHRFHADRGDGSERRAGAGPRGGGRAHSAGRRQYRPGAGAAWWRSGWRRRARGIDSRQHQALWNNCRVAKEKLLEPDIESEGAAGHDSGQRHRAGGRHDQGHAAARAISSRCWATASCRRWRARRCRRRSGASGLQELGLPYAADPAITRHMARFLRQQAASAEHGAVRRGPSGLACPTHVLFNGGVLNARAGARAHSGDAERLAGGRRHAAGRSR